KQLRLENPMSKNRRCQCRAEILRSGKATGAPREADSARRSIGAHKSRNFGRSRLSVSRTQSKTPFQRLQVLMMENTREITRQMRLNNLLPQQSILESIMTPPKMK